MQTTLTAGDCAVLCHTVEACAEAFYEPLDRRCTLHHVSLTAPTCHEARRYHSYEDLTPFVMQCIACGES